VKIPLKNGVEMWGRGCIFVERTNTNIIGYFKFTVLLGDSLNFSVKSIKKQG
jgi:hypothetical protein